MYHNSTAFSWVQRVTRVHIHVAGFPGYDSLSLPMSPNPTPPQQCNASHSRSDSLSSLPPALHTPPSDVQLEWGGVHSRDQSGSSAMGIDHSITIDLGALVNLDDRLRQLLPESSYVWFGEGGLELVGTRPVDAGGFADVWVGKMGGRRVAVKSYRCSLSGNCALTYKVSHT